MNKTLKELALENQEFLKKKEELQIIIEKNQLENVVLKKISDNLENLKLDIWDSPDQPIFEMEIEERKCESVKEDYIWQEAIGKLAVELTERLKKEGLKLDLARIDGKIIKLTFFNYLNPLIYQENKNNYDKNKKELIKSLYEKEPFDKSMAIHSAQRYIKSFYDLDSHNWEKVPNYEKISEILNFLYEKKVKTKFKISKNSHSTETSEYLILLIQTYNFGRYSLLDLIYLGLVGKVKLRLK